MPATPQQRIGVRYGNLIVVGLAEDYVSPNGVKLKRFICKCNCGGQSVTGTRSFSEKKAKLNGCNQCFSKRMSDLNTKHAGTKGGKTRLFNIWKDMRKRCRDRLGKNSKNYALRGISVCKEWGEFSTFRAWAFDCGYDDKLTIERNNVNGNYEPSNCRWIPKEEQARNTRATRRIDFCGRIMTAAEAERSIGLHPAIINGFRNQHKITHQEAFDKLLCREVLKAVNAERMSA